MIKIRPEQQAALVISLREGFLRRLALHLNDAHKLVYPGSDINFTHSDLMGKLRFQMGLLLKSGIETELDIATIIEYFELYRVNFNDQQVLETLRISNTSVSEKLDALWALREK